ncbi:DUF427 domain-containing protein [Jatrophihabitans sp. YIM 134969]
MRDFPEPAPVKDRVEPAPRRVRGVLGGVTVFDTRAARYVWETVKYPQYHLPLADVAPGVLVDEGKDLRLRRGTARVHGLRAGGLERASAARVYGADATDGLVDTVRIDWDALDAWFEEDEQVFVHPRNPYVRVDALRSSAHVRVEADGVLLAESTSPVLVFETGLPTRYYVDLTDVDTTRLVPSDTVTACPYKGRTTSYWSVDTGRRTIPDAAWSYGFPTPALTPIAGLVAFYNDVVDLVVDGRSVGAVDDLSRRPGTESPGTEGLRAEDPGTGG